MTNQVGNSTFWMSASFDDWIRRILDACCCHLSAQDIWFCHLWSSIVSNPRKQWRRMHSRSTNTCSLYSFVRPRISLASSSPTIHGVTVVCYPHISATSVDLSATVGPRLLPYGTDNLPVKLQLGLGSCFTPPFTAVTISNSRADCFKKIPCIPGNDPLDALCTQVAGTCV